MAQEVRGGGAHFACRRDAAGSEKPGLLVPHNNFN